MSQPASAGIGQSVATVEQPSTSGASEPCCREAVILAQIRAVLEGSGDWGTDTSMAIDGIFAAAGQPLNTDECDA